MDGGKEVVVETKNLTKTYGKIRGIENLNLKIHQGEIFSLLGPNGSGKTTTINLLLDLIRPTAGTIRIFNQDPAKHGKEIKKRIGFLPAKPGLYPNMRGIEYLNLFAGIRKHKNRDRFHELAEYFFNVDLNRKIAAYSEGMKQLLVIIQAFAFSPDLYILDEPSNSLDPLMKQRFYELVESEAAKGKTILLSSHILADVEKVSSRVGIIREGIMVALDTIDSLRKKTTGIFEINFSEEIDPKILQIEGVLSVKTKNNRYYIETTHNLKSLLSCLAGLPIERFDYHKTTLEEIFMEYFNPPRDRVQRKTEKPGET